MSMHGAPMPPRSCLDLARTPTTAAELDTLRAAAWHRHGVAALPVADITDDWLRQAVINEANRRWGRRNEETNHGR